MIGAELRQQKRADAEPGAWTDTFCRRREWSVFGWGMVALTCIGVIAGGLDVLVVGSPVLAQPAPGISSSPDDEPLLRPASGCGDSDFYEEAKRRFAAAGSTPDLSGG
jgi:hypothetical protein